MISMYAGHGMLGAPLCVLQVVQNCMAVGEGVTVWVLWVGKVCVSTGMDEALEEQ